MSPTSSDSSEYRLPLDVRPAHYNLTIRTDLEELKFDGFVSIDLDVKTKTSTIVFNSAELNFKRIMIHCDMLQTQQVDPLRSYDADQERTTVHLATPLPSNSKATLNIAFDGKLTGSMTGYYLSSYQVDGETKYHTVTQFQPIAARRAFPCWDEPSLKATFAISLISHADTVNLSNMSVASETPYPTQQVSGSTLVEWLPTASHNASGRKNEWKITQFDTTPPMSTYLVAYANGPFEYLESSYISPLSGTERPLRVYATKDVISQAQFSLDVKARVMPIYEKVFEVEYPLPKLDTLIATDFLGGMENWGLIIGQTKGYLHNPARVDIQAQKSIVTTQSHEVAHQWFGNITTMEWWDGLYLNEGFATLVGEVLITDKVYPEWKVRTEFVGQKLNQALALDAKLSSHPIEMPLPNPNYIYQIFDALSYAKGASVLQMLSEYVGEEKFLKGVSVYLKRHLYDSTVSKDLWDAISEATGKSITSMMQTWVEKMGFPFVTVTEIAEGIKVRQDRFLETGPAEPTDNETIWTIPLSLLTVGEDGNPVVDKETVLDSREMIIPLNTTKPYKLNTNTVGVYRVRYLGDRAQKIAEEAAKSNSVFSVDDRIGLVYDTKALAEAGYIKASRPLNLALILSRKETEFAVWESIRESIDSLNNQWFENDLVVEKLNAFCKSLFASLVDKLGYDYPDSEDVNFTLLRTISITAAALSGDSKTIAELKNLFAKFQETADDNIIPTSLVRITYVIAVTHGTLNEYDAVKKIYENTTKPSVRTAAIAALGAYPEATVARKTLEYALGTARKNDLPGFFRGAVANVKTRRLLAAFFKENYDEVYEKYKDGFMLSGLIKICFANLASEKDYEETAAFFKNKDTGRYTLALQQTLDTIRANATRVNRDTDELLEWLQRWESDGQAQ